MRPLLLLAVLLLVFDARTARASVVIDITDVQLVSESCGPANGAMDPGETVTYTVTLANHGQDDVADLVVTLEPGAGVSQPSGAQDYGVVVPGSPPVSRPFSFSASGTCGNVVTAKFHLRDGATDLGELNLPLRLGKSVSNVFKTYSSGNLAIPIPATGTMGDMQDQHIVVPEAGVIADLDVEVRLDHTADGDLTLTLVSPEGTAITLCAERGVLGHNFGAGSMDCSGTHTVFDDESIVPIGSGTPPFAARYRPETPLSVLDGTWAAGTWTLKIHDGQNLDSGHLGCWKLDITRFPYWCTSCPTAGVTAEAPPTSSAELRPLQPNPFTSSTNIRYALPARAAVELTIYAIDGRRVATLVNEVQEAGEHAVRFAPNSFGADGRSLSGVGPGVYFCLLRAGDSASTRRMLFIH